MILLSTSQSVRKAFHIVPVETTPLIPTTDWYRFWRVDARKIRGLGEIMLFTNYETLFTFVVDSRKFREASDFISYFALRYGEVFNRHFGYNGRVREHIVAHRAVDRSVIGVMNSFFLMIEYSNHEMGIAGLERWLNDVPVVSRNLFPADCLRKKLLESV